MIIHGAAHLLYQQFREIWWGVGTAAAPSGGAGGGGGGALGGAALLDRRSQSTGAKAGMVLKSIIAVLRDAKIHLENIHVRFEDDGSSGSLAWASAPQCMGLTIRDIEMTKSKGTGSAQDPFPDMPKDAEWDEKNEVGSIAIDQTLNAKGLSVYFEPMTQPENGGGGGGDGDGGGGKVGTSGNDPARVAQLLASFGAPFCDTKATDPPSGPPNTGAAEKFGLGTGTSYLLEGMELSARVYVGRYPPTHAYPLVDPPTTYTAHASPSPTPPQVRAFRYGHVLQ